MRQRGRVFNNPNGTAHLVIFGCDIVKESVDGAAVHGGKWGVGAFAQREVWRMVSVTM